MPFKSPKQEGYMWVHHPDIAKRWAHEFGTFKSEGKTPPEKRHKSPKLNMKPGGTPSNESWHPATTKLPRKGGFARDFANLKPPSSARFKPKNRPTPNEHEAMKEPGVGHMPGVHKGQHHKMNIKEKVFKGFHARDVSSAHDRAMAAVNMGGNSNSAM